LLVGSQRARAIRSVAPPAGQGMSSVMGFEGYDCAWRAFPANKKAMEKNRRTATGRIEFFLIMLSCLPKDDLDSFAKSPSAAQYFFV
jgi:hypothetical protein